MLKDGNLKFGQLVRNALVEKLNQKAPEFIPLSSAMCKKSGLGMREREGERGEERDRRGERKRGTKVILNTKFYDIFSSSRPSSITDFDASEVAKQLTILDADYFYKVDVSEMLYWAKEHNEEKCPRLTQFTSHFNNVSQW